MQPHDDDRDMASEQEDATTDNTDSEATNDDEDDELNIKLGKSHDTVDY